MLRVARLYRHAARRCTAIYGIGIRLGAWAAVRRMHEGRAVRQGSSGRVLVVARSGCKLNL